eukprot:CAMPEP_0196659800 /NCGR_PEP_ID=MMETSP1086-20130531/36619_1 /TAXON_ID=77921 /ORGANISM="Cyanoptyche  gloeocystis , Strain SAG4.97" /LENGTH=107 /DNA_ID=CAMNT_0041993919 /DNA_START=676 /DNA_END=996 /DNA_ORIENTATION=+
MGVTGIQVDAGGVTRKPSGILKNGANVQKCCWKKEKEIEWIPKSGSDIVDRATRATDGKGSCYGEANEIVWIDRDGKARHRIVWGQQADACRYFPLVCCGPAVFSAR